MSLKLFPWENEKEPYWENPENGIEWYVDESITRYCTRELLNGSPPLHAVCFYVVEVEQEEKDCICRVLIDSKSNEVLAEETSLEQMAVKIDLIRFSMQKTK